MRHARIEHDGRAVEGEFDGDAVRADGLDVKLDEVRRWLSPVEPGKILATHLTYRSRAEEYRMARLPSTPSAPMSAASRWRRHRTTR